MSVFELFEYARRANADFLTANPAERLSAEELTQLAAQAGLTVEELRTQLTTPNIQMTCALCGQPSTHLISCRGCGGDAWGGELVMAEGEDVHARLRAHFKAALTHQVHLDDTRQRLAAQGYELPLFSPEQIEHAAKHAYAWGGCMICSECWHHTLPVEAYETCPLKLLADDLLYHSHLPFSLQVKLWDIPDERQQTEYIRDWIDTTWDH